MNQAALDYIKGRVAGSEVTLSGEITISNKVFLDNGNYMIGTATRDISAFDETEAAQAAYDNAIQTLLPGIDLVLSKK